MNAYDEHSIRYLVFADATTENNHTSLLRFSRELVQVADILNDVYYETRVLERMEVYHVSQRSIGKRGAEDRNVVLIVIGSVCNHQIPDEVYSLCTPSSIQIPRCLSPFRACG